MSAVLVAEGAEEAEYERAPGSRSKVVSRSISIALVLSAEKIILVSFFCIYLMEKIEEY